MNLFKHDNQSLSGWLQKITCFHAWIFYLCFPFLFQTGVFWGTWRRLCVKTLALWTISFSPERNALTRKRGRNGRKDAKQTSTNSTRPSDTVVDLRSFFWEDCRSLEHPCNEMTCANSALTQVQQPTQRLQFRGHSSNKNLIVNLTDKLKEKFSFPYRGMHSICWRISVPITNDTHFTGPWSWELVVEEKERAGCLQGPASWPNQAATHSQHQRGKKVSKYG